jgi:hypothetical protein
VACLETSSQLDSALNAQIQDVAESLLPPKTLRQAEILARIGEPLLDPLAERPVRGARQATATIRTASMVGGDAALKIIAACGGVDGHSVGDEMIRAWPLFDAEEYARIALSGSVHAVGVTLRDPILLAGLRHITQLSWLNLRFLEGTAT